MSDLLKCWKIPALFPQSGFDIARRTSWPGNRSSLIQSFKNIDFMLISAEMLKKDNFSRWVVSGRKWNGRRPSSESWTWTISLQTFWARWRSQRINKGYSRTTKSLFCRKKWKKYTEFTLRTKTKLPSTPGLAFCPWGFSTTSASSPTFTFYLWWVSSWFRGLVPSRKAAALSRWFSSHLWV